MFADLLLGLAAEFFKVYYLMFEKLARFPYGAPSSANAPRCPVSHRALCESGIRRVLGSDAAAAV
jgi:hypothetical protein